MLPAANPGPQQEPASSQGGGLLAASPDQLAAQAAMQQAPPATQPELSAGAKTLIEEIKQELRRRYRNPSFVVPMSIKEPPIATQLPGLIEGGAHAPVAFPTSGFQAGYSTNMNPAMGMQNPMGGMGHGMGMAGLPGVSQDPLAALMQAAGGAGMGGPAGPQASDPSRILNSPPPPQQQPLGFNPEDVLLM